MPRRATHPHQDLSGAHFSGYIIILLMVGIIGMSAGPMRPALFTDYVFHSHAMLRYSLALSTALIGPITIATLSLGLREYCACSQKPGIR